MKRYFCVVITIAIFLLSSAQTQQGYVKTKGRLSSTGKHIKGVPVSGAIVTVRGRNAVVSGGNGTFSLSIPSGNYYLESVKKQGYVLNDPDMLSKTYTLSKDPLVLVLDNLDQRNEERKAIERKVRSSLWADLNRRDAEIESLKEQNKITDEKYRELRKQLAAYEDENQDIISDMVERYSKIDYDELDEFNRRISEYILNGELLKADSLLKTKGDVNVRADEYRQMREQISKEEGELAERTKKLEKSRVLAQKKMEDTARDCYSWFEIYKMKHMNDSAAYYLEMRAALDPNNIEWLLSSANYIADYLSDYKKAEKLIRNALQLVTNKDGSESKMVSYCLNDLAGLFSERGYYDQALALYKQSAEIRILRFGEYSNEYAKCCSNIALVYKHKEVYDSARIYHEKALQIYKRNEAEGTKIGSCYVSIGMLERALGDNKKAIEYYNMALPYFVEQSGDVSFDMAELCNAMGAANADIDSLDTALRWYERALNINKKLYGEDHPCVAVILDNIGVFYSNLAHYNTAYEYHEKALDIRLKTLGQCHPDVGYSYNNIGAALYGLGKITEGLEYMRKGLDLDILFYGENSLSVAADYANIATCWSRLGKHDEALQQDYKILDIYTNQYGRNSTKVAYTLCSIADVYSAKKDFQQAIDCYLQAINIYKNVNGDHHSSFIQVLNNLSGAYNAVGEYNKEMECLQRALEISNDVYGEESIKTGNIISNLAIAYYTIGDLDKAMELNMNVTSIKRKFYGEDSEEVADEIFMLAHIYEKKGLYIDAIKSYSNYVQSIRKLKGDDSRRVLAGNMLIYSIFNKLLQESPVQQNMEWFQQFMLDKSFVVIIVDGGIASKKGLNGEYQLLQYYDWAIDNDFMANFYISCGIHKDDPKGFVVIGHEGQVEMYNFEESSVGIQLIMKYIDPIQKQSYVNAWQKWKNR